MERIQNVNPERIRWCCNDYGITPEDLAERLKIPQSRLNALLEGADGITYSQLRRVADFFGRGVLFFLESGTVDETQLRTANFRTLANQKSDLSPKMKALIERVESHRELYLSLCSDLDEEEFPRFRPPNVPERNPQRAAAITRAWLGLADENTFRSYREAVESKGVLVFSSLGYRGAWRIPSDSPIVGFSLFDPACPVIMVKKESFETRQSFTLMHELGHLLLDRDSFIDEEEDLQSHNGREQSANAFAGHLLVPDAFLAQISDVDRPKKVSHFDDWLDSHRREWGVSTEVILRRLLDAGRLNASTYRAYRRWRHAQPIPIRERGSRKYRAREPLHIFGSRYVKSVFDALHAREITLNKASRYLDNLKIKDVHRLEEYIAGH